MLQQKVFLGDLDDEIDEGFKKTPYDILGQRKNRMENKQNNQELYEKLYHEAEEIDRNKQEFAEYIENAQLKECTFNPQTLTDKENKPRSLNAFLKDQDEFVQNVKNKTQKLKQDTKEPECTFQPKINSDYQISVQVYPKTKKVAQQVNSFHPEISKKSKNIKRSDKIENLLYEEAFQRKNRQDERISTAQSQSKILNTTRLTNIKTDNIVSLKFIKQFEESLENYQEPFINYIQLTEILQKLYFLSVEQNFQNPVIQQERSLVLSIWNILKFNNQISKRNLCQFLLVLIGIINFTLDNDGNTETEGEVTEEDTQNRLIGAFENGNWNLVSINDSKKIQCEFDLLYRNRLNKIKGKGKLPGQSFHQESTFQPAINQNSKLMADNYRQKVLQETAEKINNQQISVRVPNDGNITHAELLQIQKQCQIQQREKELSIKQNQLNPECTFKPNIRKQQPNVYEIDIHTVGTKKSNELYQLHKLKRVESVQSNDRELQMCTFQPQINQQPTNVSQNVQNQSVRGADEYIKRMKNANKQRQDKNIMLQRGYAKASTQRNNYSTSSSQQQQQQQYQLQLQQQQYQQQQEYQFQQQQLLQQQQQQQQQKQYQHHNTQRLTKDEDYEQEEPENTQENIKQNNDEKEPLLYVDVNLGPGKTERIVVFEGDTSQKLAINFAKKYNLDSVMTGKLTELLNSQISGLLTRIEEEPISYQSYDN